MAAGALIETAAAQVPGALVPAARAHEPVRPAVLEDRLPAVLLGRVELHELDQRLGMVHLLPPCECLQEGYTRHRTEGDEHVRRYRHKSHFLRDMLGHCSEAQQPTIATAIRQIFAAENATEAHERLAGVTAALEHTAPKVASQLLEAEEELLAFMAFPAEHWWKLRSTNPLERVNREIGRRSDAVGIYPNDAA